METYFWLSLLSSGKVRDDWNYTHFHLQSSKTSDVHQRSLLIGKVKAHMSQRPKRPYLILVSLAWSMPRSIAPLPWMGCLVHHRVTPQQFIPATHLYTWVKRDKKSKVPCLRKQNNGWDLIPRPLDLKFEVLTGQSHVPPNVTFVQH